MFQIINVRRGGRTAWSCTVNVQGQHLQARFWYDGQYVNHAREDAAQVALQKFGQLPAAAATPQTQQAPTPQQQQPPQPPQQQRYYGVIGS